MYEEMTFGATRRQTGMSSPSSVIDVATRPFSSLLEFHGRENLLARREFGITVEGWITALVDLSDCITPKTKQFCRNGGDLAHETAYRYLSQGTTLISTAPWPTLSSTPCALLRAITIGTGTDHRSHLHYPDVPVFSFRAPSLIVYVEGCHIVWP